MAEKFDILVDADQFFKKNKDLIRKLSPKKVRKILTEGSKPYTNAMHSRSTPRANRVVKRYSGGEVVAEYHPGNLLRSFKKLQFRGTNKFRSIFIGPKILKVGKGKGVFRNKRKVDGWYGIFQDNFKPDDRNYIADTWNATNGRVARDVIHGLQKELGL